MSMLPIRVTRSISDSTQAGQGEPTATSVSDTSCGGRGRGFQRPALQRDSGSRGQTFRASTLQCTSGQQFGALDDSKSTNTVEQSKRPMHAIRASINRGGGSSYFIRNRVREEQTQALRKLKEMQRHLEQTSQWATNGAHTEEMREAEEILELVSSLRETNGQNENVIQALQQQLSETEDRLNKSKEKEVNHWKKKNADMEKLNYERIERIAGKALEQIQSQGETTKEEVDGWKEKHTHMEHLYDELVETIGNLADENGKLLTRCQQLEKDEAKHQEDLVMIEDVYAENVILHQSMEEAVQLVCETDEKMTNFVKVHVASVNGYEEQLASLKDNLHEAAGMEDVKVLRVQLAGLKRDKDEAYLTCEVLQQELDKLRPFDESVLHSSKNADGSTRENELTDITEVDEYCSDHDGEKSQDKSAKLEEPHDRRQVLQRKGSWRDNKERLARFTRSYKHLSEYCLSVEPNNSAPPPVQPPDENPKADLRTPSNESNETTPLQQYGSNGCNGISDSMDRAAEAEREGTAKMQMRRFESMARY